VTQNPVTTPVQTPQTPQVILPATVPENTPAKSTYKDGTYSADGNYFSPGGSEQIALRLNIKDDIIADAVTEANSPSGPTAIRYQAIFVANFKQYVVGKKIDEVKLDKVSGSSLTPKGFNDALNKIKAQAKA